VKHEDRSNHQAGDSKRGDSGEQSDNQPQPGEELGAHDKKCHGDGHSHPGKRSDRRVKAKASKPAQHFLRPMREKYHSKNHPQTR
jgi:hypothetical protein